MLDLLMDLPDERRLAYVFISHDLLVERHIAGGLIVMYLGRRLGQGPTKTICCGTIRGCLVAYHNAAKIRA